MQTRERVSKGTRREIERIQVPKSQKEALPAPNQPTVFNPSTKPQIASLRIEEKNGSVVVDFVKKIIVPLGKLTKVNSNVAELIFDTMPAGTIHQTIRHTGAGATTWEATSRIETRESATIGGAVSYETGGVTIKGFADDHPLLSIGSSSETSTGWGQRVTMPGGTGLQIESAGQNYFNVTNATAPYALKVTRNNTAAEFGVLDITSNSTYENSVNRGIYVSHNSAGIHCLVPSSINLGNSTVAYGLKIQNNVTYSGTPSAGAYGALIETTGKWKTGLRIDVADTGSLADNRNNTVLKANAIGDGTVAGFFFGNGTRSVLTDAVVRIQAATGTDYALYIEGTSRAGKVECSEVDNSGVYKKSGTQVVSSRATGWGAPTGTATRTTFDTATVTTTQLAERVKALIDNLTTHGLIGA